LLGIIQEYTLKVFTLHYDFFVGIYRLKG